MNFIKKIYKKVLLVIIALYVVSVFVSQQKTLNNYKAEINRYEVAVEDAKDEKETLIAMKENANSPEYIEEIAREKLGMYLPNEKVFVDVGK